MLYGLLDMHAKILRDIFQSLAASGARGRPGSGVVEDAVGGTPAPLSFVVCGGLILRFRVTIFLLLVYFMFIGAIRFDYTFKFSTRFGGGYDVIYVNTEAAG